MKVDVYMHMCIYMYAYICTCVYVYVYACPGWSSYIIIAKSSVGAICIYMYMCICKCNICVCLSVKYVYVFVCVYVYVYTCPNWSVYKRIAKPSLNAILFSTYTIKLIIYKVRSDVSGRHL